MNAVEIEKPVSHLAEAPFDSKEFPFAFLKAFGNKSMTIKGSNDTERLEKLLELNTKMTAQS